MEMNMGSFRRDYEDNLLEELYRENSKIVYHFLLSLCHDANLSQDLMQETFLRAYQSLDRYDGSCKISTWLCQIAKHLYYQHLAKTKHEVLSDFQEEVTPKTSAVHSPPQDSPTENAAINRLELLSVLKELQKLPEQMREVIYLRAAAELSFKEIGEVMGRSENWARVNFYRGKEMLIKTKKNGKGE
ncbi:MAG: sigma-70 family RNA polymerase sigma factor [Bacteroidales bacterium]|nr:sigma-70 family RNA polymerase sigma factor [Lachnoclostridium sp.]MCM1383718.1 sigma-70 family RNA polymerase sigma factor [Lachnoclostridium sp.]MCM1464346.1 sigma-70 family RNA polymerase sigma factor [Bacteroidales bacterium]